MIRRVAWKPLFAGDEESHGVLGHRGVHPGGEAADPPARFVGHDPRRLGDAMDDRVVVRQAPPGRPQHGLAGPAARQPDAEERVEQHADLAVREPGVLVEVDDGRLGVGAELAGAAPQRVGGLQRVPPPHPLAAAVAMADVNVEPAVDRLAGDLGLVLVFDGVRHRRPAARAPPRERGLQDLIDHGRDRAEGLRAVALAGLAAGRLRVGLGRALGKRRGLTLAAAAELLDQRLQRRQSCLQFGDPLGGRSAAGTVRIEREIGLHADSTTPPPPVSARRALNKYHRVLIQRFAHALAKIDQKIESLDVMDRVNGREGLNHDWFIVQINTFFGFEDSKLRLERRGTFVQIRKQAHRARRPFGNQGFR